ncbi:sorting nexin-27 [Nematostella vectensis]|uniref:sorting nexin-27 n=1 Tax=Nematostella vectensis TaxID=45351 RepID=UPI0020775311|nr:sorting nexin-27 [Nematostella vectensis]
MADSDEGPPSQDDQIASKPRLIELKKGPNGFGFNVRGQVSEGGQLRSINGELYAPLQHVSAVLENGPAHRGGVIVGDRILEVNGTNVEGATHKHVVELIKKGGDNLTLVVIAVTHSEVEKLDSDSSSGTEYYDYSDRRVMPLTIPESRELQAAGETFMVYNIYYSGKQICSKRYKEFSNLHSQLKKEFRDFQFPKFPGKWPFTLSEHQLEARRKGLESYLQQVCSVRVIGDSVLMQDFLDDDDKMEDTEMEIELRILLPDNSVEIVVVEKRYKTREVYKALVSKIGLDQESALYFALFEVTASGFERKLKENEFPHNVYIRRYSETSTTCLALRKWVFTLAREVELNSDEVALNLLYHQALEDIKSRKLTPGTKLQQLKDLKNSSKKREYLDVARTLDHYNTVVFPHCPCDARRNGHVITTICLKSFQMKACTEDGVLEEQEHSLDWDQIQQCEADSEAMAVCFEYKKGGKSRWVKIYSEYFEYMAECVSRVMQEIEWNANDGLSTVLPTTMPEAENEEKQHTEPDTTNSSKANKPPSPPRTRAKSSKVTKTATPKQTVVFSGAIEDDDL